VVVYLLVCYFVYKPARPLFDPGTLIRGSVRCLKRPGRIALYAALAVLMALALVGAALTGAVTLL
ncbi:hypothetical protein PV678_45610, partial [Streptomyces europaeiscabiei]|nr:hypothetical protein [Streptomyces europaeiscabiei]